MNRAKIKICGITSQADAELAVALGAELLGFNFYRPSPRYVEPRAAAAIIAGLAAEIIPVGVFVNAGVAGIKAVLEEIAAWGKAPPYLMVQLHGDETPQECREVAALGVEVMKALRIRQPSDIERAREYPVAAVLLDAFRPEVYGGTGHRFDWGWVRRSAAQRIFLAGGITPDNIVEALAVGTYGVDVCSGVEARPGVKDPEKLKRLFDRINAYYGQ